MTPLPDYMLRAILDLPDDDGPRRNSRRPDWYDNRRRGRRRR